jgi:thiamine biosynthesis lipoprotein
MNTVIEIQSYEGEKKQAFAAAFAVFKKIESLCNRFDPNSEISKINQMAGKSPFRVAPEVFDILHIANTLSENLLGAFDVTIGAITDLWGIGNKGVFRPSQEEIDRVLPLVNYKIIELEQQRVFLPLLHMQIDLGGIAKEYALHLAAEAAWKCGLNSGWISAGGDICTIGKKTDASVWCIGIQHPRLFHTLLGKIALYEWDTVETSGDYRRYIMMDGSPYTHILSPYNGYPTSELISVSLIYRRDEAGISVNGSGLMVLGLQKSMEVLQRFPAVEAVFVTKDQHVIATKGLKDYFSLISSSEEKTIEFI